MCTDTDVPSTSDEISFGNLSEEEIDFDDDYVVHGGGPDPSIMEQDYDPIISMETSEEVTPILPTILENEPCEADAEEAPRRGTRQGLTPP